MNTKTLFAAGTVEGVYPRPVIALNTAKDLPEDFLTLDGCFCCCFEDDTYKAVEIMGYHENDHVFKLVANGKNEIALKIFPRYSQVVVWYHLERSLLGMIAWLSQNTKATLHLGITAYTDQIDFISRRDGSIFYKTAATKYQIIVGE